MKLRVASRRSAGKDKWRVKVTSGMHLKLYTDTFAKVQKRANAEGTALPKIVSDIVDEYYDRQLFEFDEVRYREEVLARLTDMLKEHHAALSEQLSALQRQFAEIAPDSVADAAELSRLSAEAASLSETLLAQKSGINLILNLCIEIALRVMTAEHFLLHYLADPYLAEHSESFRTSQLLDSIEQPEKYLSAATVTLQNRLHQMHRLSIRKSLEDARKHTERG